VRTIVPAVVIGGMLIAVLLTACESPATQYGFRKCVNRAEGWYDELPPDACRQLGGTSIGDASQQSTAGLHYRLDAAAYSGAPSNSTPLPSSPTPPKEQAQQGPSDGAADAAADKSSIARTPEAPPTTRADLKPVSSGTGFYVDRAGDVLTAWHVVEGCAQVALVDGSGTYPIVLVAHDERDDLALLRGGHPTASSAVFRSTPAEFGESAYIIGFPLLGTLRSVNITSGIVSSLAGYKGYDGWLQTSAAAQPGNSGGPMPDEGGMVIGVIVSKLESLDAENISWAVKNEVTIAFARSAAAQVRLSSAIARLETRQLARNAAKYTVALICLQ
jgi:S1-C subfamily serine protease